MVLPGAEGPAKRTHDKTSKTVHTTSDINGGRIARGAKSVLACLALSLAFGTATAGPPAGTTIPNQARATGQQASSTLNVSSNVVIATVGATAAGTPGGLLESNRNLANVVAGTTVYARHTLTNTGTAADTFT